MAFRSMAWVRLLVSSALVGAGVATFFACEPPMPGTALGIYAVAGIPGTNSCGAGLQAPDPWNFNIELSQSGSLLYWNWLDGSAILSATLVNNAANLTLSQSGNVDATDDGGIGPCNMERDDDIAMTVTGSPPTSFTGTITYNFSAVSGSDCSDQLTSNGGLYDTLPCTVSYTLSGNQTSSQ
jgi:hypothetical protein